MILQLSMVTSSTSGTCCGSSKRTVAQSETALTSTPSPLPTRRTRCEEREVTCAETRRRVLPLTRKQATSRDVTRRRSRARTGPVPRVRPRRLKTLAGASSVRCLMPHSRCRTLNSTLQLTRRCVKVRSYRYRSILQAGLARRLTTRRRRWSSRLS